jgi:hypothetical protein
MPIVVVVDPGLLVVIKAALKCTIRHQEYISSAHLQNRRLGDLITANELLII